MKIKLWGAFTETPKHSVRGVTLHTTYREALDAVADYLRIGNEDDDALADAALAELSDEDLSARLCEWVNESGTDDDYFIEQVDLPESIARALKLAGELVKMPGRNAEESESAKLLVELLRQR